MQPHALQAVVEQLSTLNLHLAVIADELRELRKHAEQHTMQLASLAESAASSAARSPR